MSETTDHSAPATMRAVIHERYGGPEVLSTGEVARPSCAPGDVVVRVHAAEACKSDCEMRSFRLPVWWYGLPLRLLLGVRRPRKKVLGLYFAGVIDEVGADVDGFAPGQAVYGSPGLRRGAYAEFAAVSGRAAIAPKPRSATFAEAAAVPLGAINALHFVRELGVGPGERVLVNGAGGVIGAYAVQLAAAAGATVTGVDAAHKEAFVRSMGATDFVDYRERDVTTLDTRFDAIVDMVAGSRTRGMLDLLDTGGRYAHGNPRLSVLARARFAPRSDRDRMTVRTASENRSVLGELADMIDAGEIRPIVDRVLPMDEVSEAHRLVETEERIGAIVLAVSDRAGER